jgi:autotransporter translocation and assembly factor TamB
MNMFRKIFRWTGFAVGLLLLIAVIGAVIYTHTDAFRELVRQKALQALNQSIRGRVDVARVEGSVWGNLTLIDFRVAYGDNEIARFPRLQMNHSLLPLLWGRVLIFRLSASQPELWLKQNQEGQWNLVEAFAPVHPEPSEPSKWLVAVKSIDLERATVELHLSNEQKYSVRELALNGNVGVQPAGIALDLNRISARVTAEHLPRLAVSGQLSYQNQNAPESLEFKEFVLESGASTLKASGKITDLKTPIMTARLVLAKLAPADLARFVPAWPVKSDLSGTAELRGPLGGLEGDFSLLAADGTVTGTFHADVTGTAPVYRSGIRMAGVNIAKLLQRSDLKGIVSATLQLRGRGFRLADIEGSADAAARAAQITSFPLGDVSAKVELRQQIARTTGRIQGELGTAEWQGQLALHGRNQYDVAFSASQLDVRKLLRRGEAGDGKLNLTGAVQGSGFTVAAANAQAKINILRSELRGITVEQGRLAARLSDRRIRISDLLLKAGDTDLSARGDLGIDPKQQGSLEYRLRVGEISPWLALLGRRGSGAVTLIGSARGNLADVSAQGKLALARVSFQGAAVRSGSIAYNLTYSTSRPSPYGAVDLNLSGIERGYGLDQLQGTVKILPKLPYTFDVDLRARDTQARAHAIAASIEYAPSQIAARITSFTTNLPDGTWRLAQPVTVAYRGDDFLVDYLTLQNGARSVSIVGRFSLSGSQSLRLTVERLPVDSVRGFYGNVPDITGIISGEARVMGTASAPQISAAMKLDDSKIGGQRYLGSSLALSYASGRADVTAVLQQDQLHRLDASGSMPVALSWSNGWRFEPSGAIVARAHSTGLSIAFLNAFSGKTIRAIGGELALDVQVRGTLEEPTAAGSLRLRNGRLIPVALGIEVASIVADARLEPRGIRIMQMTAAAKDGKLSGSGFIGLEKFAPQTIDLALAANGWPAINTQQYQADVNGALNVAGTLTAPRVTGKVEVLKAELRPDLAFLKQGSTPTKRDPTIKLVGAKAPAPVLATPAGTPAAAQTDLWQNAAVEIQVTVPNNAWLRHANANVELSGKIKLEKPSGGKLALIGLLEVVRGWAGFQGRRFNLTRGVVTFTGGEKINPALDIVGEYRTGEYVVDATVSGNAEKPALTFSSQPQMDQSDILAVLLFGKPMAALNQGEALSLQQSAVNVASGFAAGHIVKAVSQSLGLQDLGLDPNDVEVAEGRVRIGRYVGDQTFFSVSQEITGKYGQEVSVEFRITKDWKLGVSSSSEGTNGVDLIWHKRY